MLAYQIASPGAAPALATVTLPPPAPGEVQVRIAACGLNFADLLMIEGRYQDTPALPFTLGMELSGVVTAQGPGAEGPTPGTRVAVFSGQGGLAEAGNFPAGRCIPLPAAMGFAEAAAFQIAYGTSHLALDHRAHLCRGETLLVLGAAGGVGLTAVAIGKRMGARVIAVARGAHKLAVAQAAGADVLIDATTPDLRAAVKALGSADVVFDAVGGDLGRAALAALRPGGRYLVIGFASGSVPDLPANHLLVKNIAVHGFNWSGYLALDPKRLADSMAQLFAWRADGGLDPHISHRLPLARVAEALELLRTRKSTGKVVVTMPDFDASPRQG